MRIIHITDFHVSENGEVPKGDINTKKNLERILQSVAQEECDFICFTGDACLDQPAEEIYVWIKEQFDSQLQGKKIYSIPGNHDDSNLFSKYLTDKYDEENDETYFTTRYDDHHIIFLDSGKGKLSGHQKSWMEKKIGDTKETNIYIFMHHPPILSGVPYMDVNYAFRDSKDFLRIVNSFPHNHFHIFCGHYHVERTIVANNMTVYITPSTYFQIDASQAEFAVDHTRIGYRIIEIKEEGQVQSTVKYL